MKVLLDTSFLRHLGLVDGFDLILELTNNLGWEFKIPQIVIDELNEKTLDEPLRKFMQEGLIQTDSCTEQEFFSIKQSMLGLDDGELEAICIINKCDDRKFKKYLILTDDKPAQKQSFKLGINSLDIVTFLFYSNQKGLFNKELALKSLEILQENDYYVDREVQNDFHRRLL